MKAFVTGATGFIGGHRARKPPAGDHDGAARGRAPDKAGSLRALGCERVAGDLSDGGAIARATTGCEAVFHIGAMYKVGIPKSAHPAMYDANVLGTQRVIDAAVDAG